MAVWLQVKVRGRWLGLRSRVHFVRLLCL